MIPRAFVTEWRRRAPWPSDDQVEQDLVLTRALIELFQRPPIGEALAIRGGTALSKLYLEPAHRYSEDIDFVQLRPGPIGAIIDLIREILDPWLGTPIRKRSSASAKLIYKLALGRDSRNLYKLKLEINTREHESVFGLTTRTLSSESRWFQGSTEVTTYILDELLATKLRALYQRKKGRDLYDLFIARSTAEVDPRRVVEAFVRYLDSDGLRISRSEFEANLDRKVRDDDFLADLRPLVADYGEYDVIRAARLVLEDFIAKIP